MGASGIGGLAPDFTLRGTRLSGGKAKPGEFRLSEHRGSPVVLAFSDADHASYAGWAGLSAEVWAFPAQDAVAAGFEPGVSVLDPSGVVRWAQAGGSLPNAADIGGQLLLILPGPMGGTFNLAPPPG